MTVTIILSSLNPQFTGLWRDVAVDVSIPQGDGLPPLEVKAGDRIWASFKNAHLDVCCFLISLW
jgi:hypothetical protein